MNFHSMENNSKSSQATLTPVSTPKTENDWYVPENVIEREAIIRKVFYSNELNQSSLISDLIPEFLSGKETSTAEENRYSSRLSESGQSKLDETLDENVSFVDIFGNKSEQLKQRPEFSTAEIGDDFQFFTSDVGKEMLLKDEEEYAKESMMNVTSCSSWSICTRKYSIDASLPDVNGIPKQRCYTVGQYMRKMSEPLGPDISGEVFCEKVNFGCDASTPVPGRIVLPEFSEIDSIQYKYKTPKDVPFHGDIPDINIHSQNECISPIKTENLFPMFLYSVKKETFHFDYKRFMGTTNYKNIQRLEEAEKRRKYANSAEKLPFTLNCSYSSAEMSFGISPQDDTILKIDTTGTTIEIAHGENSVTEKWIVQPQELTLDINSKGSRILLMNYSDTNLKFKTKFDSKMTNVCPISGILPAKSEIGLRILVSRYIKKQFKHDAEDAVIITCGKSEKAIQVKICKNNSKQLSLKDRSFICF